MTYATISMSRCTSCLAAALCVAFFSATAVCDEPSPADLEFFEKKVRPLLVTHCYECHSGKEHKGGLLLDSAEGWKKGGDSGVAIVPGNVNTSRLISAIRYDNEDLQMPPSGKLSPADIQTLEHWVSQGAVDPRTAAAAGNKKAIAGLSIEEGRKFWSFVPVQPTEVPQPATPDWVQQPIDAFILSKLQAAGLQPAPKADRRTLIRRATFDLTGLPPSPAEVEAFLADDSADAYEKLIDRLLASPDYGVRWGRHWLDVARYADSNGLDENRPNR